MAATLVDLDLMTLPLPAYLMDYPQIDMKGMWYRFVNFFVKKSTNPSTLQVYG